MDTSRINRSESAELLLAPLKYLASDKLRGRHVGLPEIDTAAQYIANDPKQPRWTKGDPYEERWRALFKQTD